MVHASWILSAALLLVDAASAKAIYFPSLKPRSDREDAMSRAASRFEGELDRRSPSTTTSLPIGSSNTTMNSTVAAACSSAVSAITHVDNAAGFSGCYNILEWDPSTALFQADLRIYQQSSATGDFANISASEITVMLNYPDSTQFKSMVKRSTKQIMVARDGSAVQIQQYSLAGSFKQKLDIAKLNETSLASLMVPQITLQAQSKASQQTVTTNMTASDSAWFVAGQLTGASVDVAKAANPATASAAITASTPFVLPGRTFGIFPTGLIVTSTWTLLFFIAYGLGTVGRIRNRTMYRKRVSGLGSRGGRK